MGCVHTQLFVYLFCKMEAAGGAAPASGRAEVIPTSCVQIIWRKKEEERIAFVFCCVPASGPYTNI